MAGTKRTLARGRTKSVRRVLVIYKKSTYQLMVAERKNPHARALLERKDRAVERMIAAHEDHVHTIQAARTLLVFSGATVIPDGQGGVFVGGSFTP